MIDLTRLNGSRLLINCDLIKFAEPNPDTTITLVTGEKLIVLESCDDLLTRILAYRAAVLSAAWPDTAPALSAKAIYELLPATPSRAAQRLHPED